MTHGVHDDAWGLAEQVRTGRAGATELVERFLSTLDTPLHKQINAFSFVAEASALDAARAVDAALAAGKSVGPLAGVPFGVKELQQVRDWPYTFASRAFADRVGSSTDTMIERLVAAGAIPVGLTTSPELGRSSFCSTPLNGTTRNPWDLELTTGGSSSGSAAAVASGLTAFSTGSDGAGSLRIPASYCGVVGVKTSPGVVPRGPKYGGVAGNQAYGALTTTVRDAALVLDAVTGTADGEVGSVPPPGSFVDALTACPENLTIGFSPDLGYSPVEDDVRRLTEAAFAQLVDAVSGTVADVSAHALPDTSRAFRLLAMLDVHAQVRELAPEQVELLHPSVRQYSDAINEVGFDDYLDAHLERDALTRVVSRIFDDVDVLVTPTTPVRPFSATGPMPRNIAGTDVDHWGSLRLTYPFNLTGHPAISVPVAVEDGSPVGLQLVVRRYRDPLLVGVAARYEAVARWPRHATTVEV